MRKLQTDSAIVPVNAFCGGVVHLDEKKRKMYGKQLIVRTNSRQKPKLIQVEKVNLRPPARAQ